MLLNGAGALVRYLPPYSPVFDFNPIEVSYHKAKDFIRENNVGYRCWLQPHLFILHVFAQSSPENCEGYFRNFGYEWRFDWSNNFEPFRYILCGILKREITELSLVIVNDFLNNCQIIKTRKFKSHGIACQKFWQVSRSCFLGMAWNFPPLRGTNSNKHIAPVKFVLGQ